MHIPNYPRSYRTAYIFPNTIMETLWSFKGHNMPENRTGLLIKIWTSYPQVLWHSGLLEIGGNSKWQTNLHCCHKEPHISLDFCRDVQTLLMMMHPPLPSDHENRDLYKLTRRSVVTRLLQLGDFKVGWRTEKPKDMVNSKPPRESCHSWNKLLSLVFRGSSIWVEQSCRLLKTAASGHLRNFPILHYNNSLFPRSLELGMDTSYARLLLYLRIVFCAVGITLLQVNTSGRTIRHTLPRFLLWFRFCPDHLSIQTHSCENKHLWHGSWSNAELLPAGHAMYCLLLLPWARHAT